MQLQRYAKNPILSPNPANAWESVVTTNPGVWYDEPSGTVLMLYRAAGDDAEHHVRFGLATSTNGYDFTRASDEPVFGPSVDGFDAGCVEDARIIKIDDWFYVTYAARPFPPGEYWKDERDRRYNRPDCPDDFPWTLRHNATTTGLALTKDFKTWIRAGRLTSAAVDDRDVILFPEKVGGRFVMLHRPMNWTGADYGTDMPAIWISSGDDLLSLNNTTLLAKAEFPWERKIGGNTPPIRTKHGWLTIYHAVGPDNLYRLGAMLLDLENPSIVRYRTRNWIQQPEEDYELRGFYNGVCFPCGSCVIGDTFFVYYGGADKYVGVATCPVEELIDELLRCPMPEPARRQLVARH
jgi:predicted GH43/DUF377 family glycosyl hydrolase